MARLAPLYMSGENIDIPFCPSSASQGQRHKWVSSTKPAVTLYFLIFLHHNYLTASFSSQFSTFPHSFLSPCNASVTLTISFFFTPVMLFLLTWLLKFLKFRGKLQKQIRKCLTTNKTCRESEADLNLLLTSYTLGFFPLCTRISKRCWKVGSPGEHKRTCRNAQPCFEIQSQT